MIEGKKIFIVFLLSIITNIICCQTRNFHKDYIFYNVLIQKEQYKEAEYFLQEMLCGDFEIAQQDTLFYLKGWLYYTQKKIDSAAKYLNKVSPVSSLYLKSAYFGAYSNIFLKKGDLAMKKLDLINTSDSTLNELTYFEKAGWLLLQKNISGFDSLAKNFTQKSFVLSREEQLFLNYRNEIHHYKKKSPVIAGLLSAIIPGLGKFYAGKKKEAFGGFLPILATGLLTLEAYNTGGAKDARFIVFGSLFATFYVGNIWGSTFSVKVRDIEFKNKYENNILFHLQIPIRNIFN